MNAVEQNPEAQNKPKLLVLDDNPAIVEILREVGDDAGYQVSTAKDQKEFESLYPTFLPQVIFLDLGLNESEDDFGETGLEVIKFLSREKCRSKIFIISGMSRRKRELTTLQGQNMNLQVVGHIPKPFDIEDIERQLVRLRLTSLRTL